VDLEGIAAHLFDVSVSARLRGASIDDAKSKTVKQIDDILGRTDIHIWRRRSPIVDLRCGDLSVNRQIDHHITKSQVVDGVSICGPSAA
jgi:hypothetical protein